MSIVFRCPNQCYDPATGVSQRCGKKIRVADGQAGVTAKCPACKQPLLIPRPQSAADQRPVKKTDARPADVMELDFENDADSQQSASVVAHDRTARCRQCGRPIDRKGVCVKCGYVEPSLKLAAKDVAGIKVKPAGFQLWMINILSEGMPVVVLTSMIHFLFAVVSIGAAALIVISAQGLSRVAILGALLAGVFFYVALVYKSYDFLRNPHARLAWFQRPFWNLILWWARKQKWDAGANRIVIDKRDLTLTDEDLDKVENLKNVSVLDLEGTQITDDAFRFFYRMDQLQCLVLRNTDVSHANVFRLQQTKPKLWIWY